MALTCLVRDVNQNISTEPTSTAIGVSIAENWLLQKSISRRWLCLSRDIFCQPAVSATRLSVLNTAEILCLGMN